MALTKDEIVTKKFAKSMKGYDRAEVEVYLEWIGEEVEKLINENNDLKIKFLDMNKDFDNFVKEKEAFGSEQAKAKSDIEKIKRETARYCEQSKLDARLSAQNAVKESYKKAKDLKKDIEKLLEIKNSFIRRYQSYMKDQLESLKAFQKENYPIEKK
ncbi:MAG TPA: DivIVA domain-containing protein [Clostridiales bacterium]|nr:DivIVA domain-containing protein [Clostridiales bacterium]HQP70185.1 DivIVA domain-containing protein [Clostridiales bacterium]